MRWPEFPTNKLTISHADIILLLSVICGIGLFYYYSWGMNSATKNADQGLSARIYVGKKHIMDYPLSKERSVEVAGLKGISQMQIKNQSIRFTQSPCNNHVCVFSGWQKASGDFATCIPNGVSVEIVGGIAAYDAISF